MRSSTWRGATRATSLLALLVLLGAPGLALASGGGDAGGHEGMPLREIGLHALNLGLLLGLLGFLARGKIGPALQARAAAIRQQIAGAGAAEAEAQARFAELQARLDGFEGELATMRSEAEAAAAHESAAIVAQAEREAAVLRDSAARALRDEADRARAALRAEAARLAVELAASRVSAQINEADHERLDRDFIGALSAPAEARHG